MITAGASRATALHLVACTQPSTSVDAMVSSLKSVVAIVVGGCDCGGPVGGCEHVRVSLPSAAAGTSWTHGFVAFRASAFSEISLCLSAVAYSSLLSYSSREPRKEQGGVKKKGDGRRRRRDFISIGNAQKKDGREGEKRGKAAVVKLGF